MKSGIELETDNKGRAEYVHKENKKLYRKYAFVELIKLSPG